MPSPDGYARHTPTLSGVLVAKLLVADSALIPHFTDLVTNLDRAYLWREVGDPVDDILAAVRASYFYWLDNIMVGAVSLFLGSVPAGWLELDGSTYDGGDYPELFAVLPSQLKSGSDFTLPDMSEVFPFGVETSANTGGVTGSNTLNLTVAQLPAHAHDYVPPVLTVEAETPTTPIPAAGIGSATATTSVGSGDDIDKRPQRCGFLFGVFSGVYV